MEKDKLFKDKAGSEDYTVSENLDKEKNDNTLQIKKKIKKNVIKSTLFIGVCVLVFLIVLFGGLYAVFRPYTIIMDLDDGSEPLVQTYSISTGSFAIGNPTRAGYRFTGWTGSNGGDAKRDVVISGGKLGDLSYKANWSDDLYVTCEDWLVDVSGNRIREITSEVDTFLKEGKSSKNYKEQKRTITVKNGGNANPNDWGTDGAYKAYHSEYEYIGNSGSVKVEKDGTKVYRYFYPVLDINFMLDGGNSTDKGITDSMLASFDVYVDGELVAENVYDFCDKIPCNSQYRISLHRVFPAYEFAGDDDVVGIKDDKRTNITLSFVSKSGDMNVTCEDWVVDAQGNRVKNITEYVDKFLAEGKSRKQYKEFDRTVKVNSGDVVDGALWGCDTDHSVYLDGYEYVSSSGEVSVNTDNLTVYRYFYPVLNINCEMNGKTFGDVAEVARLNVYVDDELVQENVTDFVQSVPNASEVRVEVSGYTNYDYKYTPRFSDNSAMGAYPRDLSLLFEKRSGNDFVILEDWIIDEEGNRVREITDEVDEYLNSGQSSKKYKAQSRMIIVNLEEEIDPSIFGNDPDIGAYHADYVYAGSSPKITVSHSGEKIYRYFTENPVMETEN